MGISKKLIAALAAALVALPCAAAGAAPAGPVPTPPLGWNPWYRFGCAINEQLITQTADAIVASGMAARGYRYVNIDDCWMAQQRDSSGALVADPQKFPDGIAAVADYIHARGLRLGIYIDAGDHTCAGYPGSAGHYAQDAQTLASWGVDYVKVDWCHTPNVAPQLLYGQLHDALDATGRPMVLAICNWGIGAPWTWGPAIASSWRTAGDYDWYGAPRDYWKAVLTVAAINAREAGFAHPSAWNDPDILLVGTGLLNARQERSQLSLWAMMAAPLLAGADLRSLSARARNELTNPRVIAVDQDPAGVQGIRLVARGSDQVWVRRMADGSRALLLLNAGAGRKTVSVGLGHLGLPSSGRFTVQDLWSRHTWRTSGRLAARLAPYASAMYRVWRT